MTSEVTTNPKLTAKQEAFCEEYMVDLNATQAAIRAKYSEATANVIGCENLSKPNIANRIAELKAERSARTLVDADYVISGLVEVHKRCMTDDPEKMEHSGANKSLELLGKHLGLFTDNINNKHSFDLSHISDEELNALAGQPVKP